jgi:hypothetical protein
LLIGYNATSNLSDFVTAAAEGTGTKLTIDHDGTGISNNSVTIILKNVGGGVISYQQVSKVNNICVGICLYVSYSKVTNNIIACVFKTIIKDISATLDTAAGETAIQSNVIWDIGIVNYTDATAKQYLIDTYGWTIRGGVFDCVFKTIIKDISATCTGESIIACTTD